VQKNALGKQQKGFQSSGEVLRAFWIHRRLAKDPFSAFDQAFDQASELAYLSCIPLIASFGPYPQTPTLVKYDSDSHPTKEHGTLSVHDR